MRLTCPVCGERDRREFYYQGHALALDRPAPEAAPDVWAAYVHNRDNPAGATRDLWYHDPCGAWLVVDRDTVTHAIHDVRLAREARE